uniref:Uncharacterized protein n=1 Tax=Cucumis sativus TaxID=3659 RepID=A0A0A0M0K0_CUCSA
MFIDKAIEAGAPRAAVEPENHRILRRTPQMSYERTLRSCFNNTDHVYHIN